MSDGIRVETDGLNKFSTQVQDDTSRTLGPGYSDARVCLGTGVRFGVNNASGSVHAAKARYAASVEASTANVEEYMAAARVRKPGTYLLGKERVEEGLIVQGPAQTVERLDRAVRPGGGPEQEARQQGGGIVDEGGGLPEDIRTRQGDGKIEEGDEPVERHHPDRPAK